MSHVDDGELTAYADGAWPANDPVALRIGAHLSTCENCRTRLELAHALRDRAAEILGYATPAQMSTPSFEELQAQLATSPRKPRRTIPLAWAASIMMALGLGWFGRGYWQNPPELQEIATRAAPPSATQSAAAEPDASVVQPSSQSAVPPAPVPSPAPPRTPPQVAANEARPERAEPRVDREEDMAADRQGFAAGRAAPGAGVAAAPPPSAARARIGAENVPQQLSAADAERRGLDVPRIPELPIAHVLVNGDTTSVIQTLPDGKVVTLTVTPEDAALRDQAARREVAAEAAAPMAAAAAKTAQSQPIAVRMRGKVVTVTGAMPADSLRVLAGRIR